MTTQIDVVDINDNINDNTNVPPSSEVKPKAKAKPRAKAKAKIQEIPAPAEIKNYRPPRKKLRKNYLLKVEIDQN